MARVQLEVHWSPISFISLLTATKSLPGAKEITPHKFCYCIAIQQDYSSSSLDGRVITLHAVCHEVPKYFKGTRCLDGRKDVLKVEYDNPHKHASKLRRFPFTL